MTAKILNFTERQQRERDYYDQYASSFNLEEEVDFSPVISSAKRPWNSYWAVYHLAAKVHQENFLMLDFGSGPGENALRFCKIGYRVEGFDISPSNINLSKLLFKKYGMENRGRFQEATAERLPYKDNHFDLIAGIDILHHVDIKAAIKECRRVLRPGGVAIFREPLEVPILDWIRNTRLVRMLAPKEKSFDLHITEDERKLNQMELEDIKKIFPQMKIRKFFLFARFDKFFRDGSEPHPSFLERLDYFLMNTFPCLRHLGGVGMIILRKPDEE